MFLELMTMLVKKYVFDLTIDYVIRGKYFVSEKLKIGNQVDFKPLDAMSKKERNLMEKLEIWKRNDLPKILISHSYFKT